MRFDRVRSGQDVALGARWYNAVSEAAERFHELETRENARFSRGADARDIWILNGTDVDVERFGIMGLDRPAVSPNDNFEEWSRRFPMRGRAPKTEDGGRFVILLEPAPPGRLARACAAGIAAVKVKMIDDAHRFADAAVDDVTMLESKIESSTRLLWVQDREDREVPDVAWAMARLGDGGAGGAANDRYVVVRDVPAEDSFFVTVQRVEPDESDPWTGLFLFSGDPFPALCRPGTRGEDYLPLVATGNDADSADLQILDLEERYGLFWVTPWAKPYWETVDVGATIRGGDCNPSFTFIGPL